MRKGKKKERGRLAVALLVGDNPVFFLLFFSSSSLFPPPLLSHLYNYLHRPRSFASIICNPPASPVLPSHCSSPHLEEGCQPVHSSSSPPFLRNSIWPALHHSFSKSRPPPQPHRLCIDRSLSPTARDPVWKLIVVLGWMSTLPLVMLPL